MTVTRLQARRVLEQNLRAVREAWGTEAADRRRQPDFNSGDDWQKRLAAARSLRFVVDFLDADAGWLSADLAFALRGLLVGLDDLDAHQPPDWLAPKGAPSERTSVREIRGRAAAIMDFLAKEGGLGRKRAADELRKLLGEDVTYWLVGKPRTDTVSPRAIERWRDEAMKPDNLPEKLSYAAMSHRIARYQWPDPAACVVEKAKLLLAPLFEIVAAAGGPVRKLDSVQPPGVSRKY